MIALYWFSVILFLSFLIEVLWQELSTLYLLGEHCIT
jgi:hypothetical protein